LFIPGDAASGYARSFIVVEIKLEEIEDLITFWRLFWGLLCKLHG
jgi:hypothetical protein